MPAQPHPSTRPTEHTGMELDAVTGGGVIKRMPQKVLVNPLIRVWPVSSGESLSASCRELEARPPS